MPIDKKTVAPAPVINLEDLSTIELKSLVYDRMALIEQKEVEIRNIRNDISALNALIQKKIS